MKKFLLKSGVFIVLLSFLAGFVIFIFEKKLGALTNSYTLKRHQLETQEDSIEVITLGGSESLYGIDPFYFKLKGYNLANTSQSLFYDVHIALKYIDKMPKLKYVFIEINYFSLCYQIFDGKEKWRDYFYAQGWNIKFPEVKASDMSLHSKILLYTPEMSLAYALKGFHVNLVKGYYPSGWAKIPTISEINDINAYSEVMGHNAEFVSSRYENIKATEDTFLTELKKRGIIPVLYTLPVSSLYYKYTDKKTVELMYKTISYFCNKYGCKYYDYFTDSRFQNSDFGDANHLDSIGAVKFSKILNQDILESADSVK